MRLKLTVLICFILSICSLSIGQTLTNDSYVVKARNGNGIKFYGNNNYYKIHFGNHVNNKYGPVTTYSTKMNMSNHNNRGWVWGPHNGKPTAALNTQGNFQIEGWMKIQTTRDASEFAGSGGLEIGGTLRIDGNEIITNSNTSLYLNHNNNGDVIVDNGTLRVDASKNMVGIGTNTPNAKLAVHSGLNQSGIQAKSPHGNSFFPYSNGWSYLTGVGIILRTKNNTPRLRVETNGDIVIGSIPSPRPAGYKLFVEQGILAEKVRVAVKGSDDWADYVFEDDYDMMSIAQLENYISTNKHLPNVPSADEVVENGLDVAAMDAKLLEKIEEAYLYIIDLQKQIDDLKSNQNK